LIYAGEFSPDDPKKYNHSTWAKHNPMEGGPVDTVKSDLPEPLDARRQSAASMLVVEDKDDSNDVIARLDRFEAIMLKFGEQVGNTRSNSTLYIFFVEAHL
jgi:hypothetical protein